MSVAFYIVLDNDDPGFDTFVDGKAVARESDALDALCEANGLPQLDSFMGQSMDDLSAMLDEEIELPDGDDGGEEWFEPQDGIDLLESLIEAIGDAPETFESATEVVEDLEAYKAVLLQAMAIGARWHLALDL